jgi:glycosyltransferase involved in cell wall biosynthesis
VPAEDSIDGFRVTHPRVPYVPMSRGAANAALYAWAVRRHLATDNAGPVDFVWSSFGFPDGAAAVALAEEMELPSVVSLLGSDVNLGMRASRRRAILSSLARARTTLAKSQALRRELERAGADVGRVHVVYNGIDQSLFYPTPRKDACARLGADESRRRVLFVGNLVPVKNAPLLLRAFAAARTRTEVDLELVLAGDGPERAALSQLAADLLIGDVVRFVGSRPHSEVAVWMAASDLICLTSLAEGVPNVVLEGLASGRPVVATDVGGIGEVHPGDTGGALVPSGDCGALATALLRVLGRTWEPSTLAALVRGFTWNRNARAIAAVFHAAGLTQALPSEANLP